MINGVGRFVNGLSFEAVVAFLSGEGGFTYDKKFTKEEVFSELGIASFEQKVAIVNQLSHSDNQSDDHDRVNIFNSTVFEIVDNVRFVVEANGDRYIENFTINPSNDVQENYDFNGGSSLTNFVNSYDDGYLYPSYIGRKVNINFVGSQYIRDAH